MAAVASGAGLPWWELPDYARVAIVLAGVVTALGLGRLLFSMRLGRTAERRVAGQKTRADGGAGHLPPQAGFSHGLNRSTQPPRGHPTERPNAERGMNEAASGHGANGHEELPTTASDPVLRLLHWIMRLATYVLAIAMVVVIIEGVVSVIYSLYLNMIQPPFFMVPNIVQTFGAFLAVLIAYEIFANITLYIRSDVFPLKLVVATALMAVARKIIILEDYKPLELVGIGAVVVGLGIAYWLISQADARCGPALGGAGPDAGDAR
ncbi:MAG: phosphate-starvation-inducible PsiE family protein [Thiohalocapsa sp.]